MAQLGFADRLKKRLTGRLGLRLRGKAGSVCPVDRLERLGLAGEGGAQRRAGDGARDERRRRRERRRVGAVGARREDGWEKEREEGVERGSVSI